MTTLDFNSEEFQALLTDALRAGPASPAWHDAVRRIRAAGAQTAAGDYELLLTARQHLESGKGYRQIRPGPEFTRKVMQAVAEEGDSQSRRPGAPATPTIIALLAGAAALIAIVVLSNLLISSGTSQRQTLKDLKDQTFSREIISTQFADGLPQEFRAIGSLEGIWSHSMRPPTTAPSDVYAGVGIVTTSPIVATTPTALEITLRLAETNASVIPQIFITDQPQFSPDRGIAPHEFVWTLQPQQNKNRTTFRQQVVLPDGTFAATADATFASRATIVIRLAFDADFVLVDSDGQRLYAGPHQLSVDQPRYVGVRFLRRGELRLRDLPAVLSIRISQ